MKKTYIVIHCSYSANSIISIFIRLQEKHFHRESRRHDVDRIRYRRCGSTADIGNVWDSRIYHWQKLTQQCIGAIKAPCRSGSPKPPDHNVANDAFKAMNSMLGGSSGHEEHENSGDVGQSETHNQHGGMMDESFTKPVKLDIMEFDKPGCLYDERQIIQLITIILK